ncbi:MAG: LCCL domain-containing protein [Chloroflexota bacterium]|nr:LCCL domain-containing protein [Chloroflexota bacterium]
MKAVVLALAVIVVASCSSTAIPMPSPTLSLPTSAGPSASAGGQPSAQGSGGAGEFKTCHPGWTTTAQNCSINVGDKLMVSCPSVGTIRYAWGTDTYTADSSVCTAAVHAGLIGVESGGDVYIEIVAGQEQYDGSERNGVTTQKRGDWLTSFVFVEAPTP